MMKNLILALFLFAVPASVVSAATDEEAFKTQVVKCRTEGCLISVAHLYFDLWEHVRALQDMPPNSPERKRAETEVARWRGQLNDPDIWLMLEDGRWDAMSEVEKRKWTKDRWGPHPDDVSENRN